MARIAEGLRAIAHQRLCGALRPAVVVEEGDEEIKGRRGRRKVVQRDKATPKADQGACYPLDARRMRVTTDEASHTVRPSATPD